MSDVTDLILLTLKLSEKEKRADVDFVREER